MSKPGELNWEVVVGLECHVQLLTQSKLFSPAPSHFGDAANQNVDVVDVALPGTLPVLNERAVECAIRLGLALGSKIRARSTFARKHYFYPDLPKGYQISQYDEPVVEGGSLVVDGRTIPIVRAHLEEDAGKSLHQDDGRSALDYNRAGTPLLEVVTEPALASADEAASFFRTLRTLVMTLGICDGDLQEGSMRADANVSVRKKGDRKLGERVELKNINSPRFLAAAVEHEMRRQIIELEGNRAIVLETRLWDADKRESRTMRSKEEAHDYRYFPDPDLPPLLVSEAQIARVKTAMPELPEAVRARFVERGVTATDAALLAGERALSAYFDAALAVHANARSLANWIVNELLALGDADDAVRLVSPQSLAKLVKLVDDAVISGKIAKDVFAVLAAGGETDPERIVDERGWRVVRDEGAVASALGQVIAENPKEWKQLLEGKAKVAGFFVGLIMKKMGGKADPKDVNRVLEERKTRG
jgi:aspartyl-tRNA(Asn)/glutamyl-tRNA(Gln) amidotransferase subunit B